MADTIKMVLIVAVILAMALGVFLIVQMLRSKSYKGDDKTLVHKDDLPILPRNQRENTDLSQAVADEADEFVEDDQDALSSLAKAISKTQAESEDLPKSGENLDESLVNVSNEFSQNSPLLDRHLDGQKSFDHNNDPLLTAQTTVTLLITPRNQATGLSGKEVLELARVYGLKYGVMNMYHRYEHEDGTGGLWFSMLGVNRQGMQTFDLNTLTDQRFTGLSLFLSLPNPYALRGFDSMISTARMIAKDLNADIHDEENYLFDENYVDKLRLEVANYQ